MKFNIGDKVEDTFSREFGIGYIRKVLKTRIKVEYSDSKVIMETDKNGYVTYLNNILCILRKINN